MRETLPFRIPRDAMDEIVARARKQEFVYGHNTGHFSLEVEKENTITGVAGEWAVREALRSLMNDIDSIRVEFAPIGAPVDIVVSHGHREEFGIHVKTGLWRRWPRDNYEFGVHADQGIQAGSQPLVLVSLLRRSEGFPTEGRIEGFVLADHLRTCPVIRRGQQFSTSRVVSQTTNLVTKFGQYERLESLRDQIAARLTW